MAQLIKLLDCISRYEWNTYRYPTQYIRLKQDNWRKLYALWNQANEDHAVEEQEVEEATSTFAKWKSFIKRESVEKKSEDITELPKTEIELKQNFLDKLYPIQLKWATSTVTDLSFVDQGYENDSTLKYFLQRFPDTYLLMYYPIFTVKKAPIDGEIILITPVGIEIIYLLEKEHQFTITASDERTWTVETNQSQTRLISPILALKRTEQIIKSILHTNNVDFPVKKLVLSRRNHIVIHSQPYNTEIIGKHDYKKWFESKRNFKSPLKNRQLKAAELLLKHCQTTSVKRPEWEEETNSFSMNYEE